MFPQDRAEDFLTTLSTLVCLTLRQRNGYELLNGASDLPFSPAVFSRAALSAVGSRRLNEKRKKKRGKGERKNVMRGERERESALSLPSYSLSLSLSLFVLSAQCTGKARPPLVLPRYIRTPRSSHRPSPTNAVML